MLHDANRSTNDPSALVEWLASRNRADLIDEYVRHYLTRNPAARPSFEEGAAMARSGMPFAKLPSGNDAVVLGWSVTTLMESRR